MKHSLKTASHIFFKFLKLLWIIISVFLTGLLGYQFLVLPIGNEIILKGYTKELKAYDLGLEYEVLASDDRCGKLSGNGNGMQYLSAELIYSEEKPALENKDWYGVYLQSLNEALEEDGFLDVYVFGSYCPNIRQAVQEQDNHEGYYILFSFYEAPWDSIWNGDLRAH